MASVGIICDRELLKPMDQRVWKQAISIRKMGYNVEIITPHHKTHTKTMQNIRIHCIEKGKLPGITALNIIIKTLKGKYDILHCHEFNPLLYTVLLKKLTNGNNNSNRANTPSNKANTSSNKSINDLNLKLTDLK